jgi:hypothetical protein
MPTCPYHSLHARPRHAHRTMHARAVYSSFHAHSGRQILLVWPLGWHQFWPTSFFWGGPFNDREGSGGSAMCCYLCVIVETSFRVSCHVHYHVYVTLWTIVCSFFLFNLLSSLCGVRKLWTVSIRPMYLSIKQPVNTFPLVTIRENEYSKKPRQPPFPPQLEALSRSAAVAHMIFRLLNLSTLPPFSWGGRIMKISFWSMMI